MPVAGVPDIVAVPLPLSTKVIGWGSDPDSVRTGAGTPEVVTTKVPNWLTVKVVPLALVMAGGLVTVMVRVGGLGSVEPKLSVTVRDTP